MLSIYRNPRPARAKGGRTILGIAIFLLLLGAPSCGKTGGYKSQGTQKSALEPILGSVDIPPRGATLSGTLTAGGWALAESGVDRVAIYFDKQFMTFATLDGNRPDIAKAFGSFPNAASSGWGAVIDLSQMIEGDHEMLMQVKSKAGHVHDFPPVPFKIVR